MTFEGRLVVCRRRARVVLAIAAAVSASWALVPGVRAQSATLRPAAEATMPATADSNSPAHWAGDTLYVFNSWNHPSRSHGRDQFSLGPPQPIRFRPLDPAIGNRWIEATWPDADGTLYGWYHNEPKGLCPGSERRTKYGLTAPRIGAVRSGDNGATWDDLGLVLSAPDGTLDCDAANGYFAGGHGDFSVMLDARQEWLYIFFGNYAGDAASQGVAVARMRWRDRAAPAGKVWKYDAGAWREPGVGGRTTPIFPVTTAWQRRETDAFWGPSVHWNTWLGRYVMLMNRACCVPEWPQEGVYISFASDLASPSRWSRPRQLYKGGDWYPQVIGLDAAARETDKRAGRVARFYMHGRSVHEIVFEREP
jgi:hypothetical protein